MKRPPPAPLADCEEVRARLDRRADVLDSQEVEAAMRACPKLDLAATLARVLDREKAAREEVLRTEPAQEVQASADGRFAVERTDHGLRVFRAAAKGAPALVLRVTVDSTLGGARFLSNGRLLIYDASALVVVDLGTLHVDRIEGATTFQETERHVLVAGPGKARLLRQGDLEEVAKAELRGPPPSTIDPIVDRSGQPVGAIVGGELVSFENGGKSLAVFSSILDPTKDGERALACVKDAGADDEHYAVVSTKTGAVLNPLPTRCDGSELTLDESGRFVLWLEMSDDRLIVVSRDVARGTRHSLRTKLKPYDMANHLSRARKMLCIWTQNTMSSMDMECGFRVSPTGAIEYVPAGHSGWSDFGNVVTIFDGSYRFDEGELRARGSDQRLLASADVFAKAPHVLLTPATD